MTSENTLQKLKQLLFELDLMLFLLSRVIRKRSEWTKQEIIELIQKVARAEGVDPDLAVRVATCESGLNPYAVNKNTNGTTDRGLYQWNDYWHPEITDEMAFNPYYATLHFCRAVKAGNLSWWNASKSCWRR